MPSEYTYRASAWRVSARTGLARCESSPNTIHFSEAAEPDGLHGRWAPEQLLLAALAGCFTTAFYEVARGAKFEYTDLELEIEGAVKGTRTNGFNFTEILIRPRLTVPHEDQREPGFALLRRANALCTISRAVTAPQTVEPVVEVVGVPVEGWTDDEAAVKLGV
jgi:organic hydroperoxide reductase OsmC/OhrA